MEKDQTKFNFNQDYLPLQQVPIRYNLSISYLYKLRYQRRLFHYSLGAKIFIRVSELEALIGSGKKT